MQLRGNLKAVRVWDLLHLLRSSCSTGELVVASPDADARLCIENGKLTAAVSREAMGCEVLEEILNWREGEFEFRAVTDSLGDPDPDLDDQLVAMGAPPSDPLVAEDTKEHNLPNLAPMKLDDPRGRPLAELVESYPFIEHACLVDTEGAIRGQSATNMIPSEDIRSLVAAVGYRNGSYPRPKLRRQIIEDERGIVVFARLKDGSGLLLVAGGTATAGAVCSAATRFVAELEGDL